MWLKDEAAPVRVHHDLTLAALHLLARIVAARATALGRFDRLAIDHGCAGRRLPSDPLPVCHDEQVVDRLKQTHVSPATEPSVTVVRGGRSLGSRRQATPPRGTYKMAFMTSRKGHSRGRPRSQGLGI